ncbi:MAG: TonB-dependent receptor [Alphaproteobacteria bacterium]|nr:MAG: TonB-dependent receptor [Alphaproteobacteria bacterium]
MKFKTKLGSVLLVSTMLSGGAAFAQAAPTPAPATTPATPTAPTEAPEAEVDVSVPGGGGSSEIVVIGRRIPNVIRSTREVVSVLSQADIARTGEGDIAGALQRVTGLSVVGGRFVYVRGLGERYSLALLNGLPIPSPDPLRRVVPLDLFPTSVLASSLVQKSYSVNFPGEFGGGVINLTTSAVPEKPFLTIGGSIGGNTVTTGELGLVYQGSNTDWLGFDDGTRATPRLLKNAQQSGNLLFAAPNFSVRDLQDITASLTNSPTNVIQRNYSIPVNLSGNLEAGTSFDMGDVRVGLVASAGLKNEWRTKAGLQQLSGGARVLTPGSDPVLVADQNYRFFSTENHIVVNGLVGIGAEFGEHKVRFTNLYIHDTIKEARIQSGFDAVNVGEDILLNRNATAWFERQLFDTQAVGEFRFGQLSVDVRGTYANSKRFSPYERNNNYAFSAEVDDFVNDLRSPGQRSDIAFSRLNENVWAGGFDLGYKFEDGPFPIKVTAGYAYSDNKRTSTRRDYRFQSIDALPLGVTQQRPDFLLSDYNVYTYGIILNETSATSGAARYDAGLTVHGGYGQIEIEPVDGVQFVAGVRYEDGKQFVAPIDLFNLGDVVLTPTRIDNTYWLPAGTLTWNFAEDMQLRLSASKTVARPQFRELAPQPFFDTESDRNSFGNQFLIDSTLFNAEARYEYYFGRDQRLTVGGFYKQITNPIETIAFQVGGSFNTTFANAPKATLYGAEAEIQKYFPLDALSDSGFLASRRILASANYTYTKSRIKVADGDTTIVPFTGQVVAASELFRDGQRLTGQSDHIVNLQLGVQDQDSLSEQTLLLTYASQRATNRGPSGQPDLTERPGLRLDFVMRQAVDLGGFNLELKFEARNLTNTRYQEFQLLNGSRIDNNTYELGRSFTFGASVNF